jgi:hypothetical protein
MPGVAPRSQEERIEKHLGGPFRCPGEVETMMALEPAEKTVRLSL